MIIIFNKDAVKVAFVALFLLLPIAILWWTDVIEEEQIFLPGSWALFTASIIGCVRGWQGRFFYVFPTWLVTLACSLYVTYHFFGQAVSIIKFLFIAFVLLLVILILFLFLNEKREIKKINKKVIELPFKDNGLAYYWQSIKYLFFFPVFSKWTVDVCNYNIKILQLLKENDIELGSIDALEKSLVATKAAIINGEKAKLDAKIKETFMQSIDHQIKIWE